MCSCDVGLEAYLLKACVNSTVFSGIRGCVIVGLIYSQLDAVECCVIMNDALSD